MQYLLFTTILLAVGTIAQTPADINGTFCDPTHIHQANQSCETSSPPANLDVPTDSLSPAAVTRLTTEGYVCVSTDFYAAAQTGNTVEAVSSGTVMLSTSWTVLSSTVWLYPVDQTSSGANTYPPSPTPTVVTPASASVTNDTTRTSEFFQAVSTPPSTFTGAADIHAVSQLLVLVFGILVLFW